MAYGWPPPWKVAFHRKSPADWRGNTSSGCSPHEKAFASTPRALTGSSLRYRTVRSLSDNDQESGPQISISIFSKNLADIVLFLGLLGLFVSPRVRLRKSAYGNKNPYFSSLLGWFCSEIRSTHIVFSAIRLNGVGPTVVGLPDGVVLSRCGRYDAQQLQVVASRHVSLTP